ncbi:MAG: N-acetyltransferase [Clostridia bacterium]|nr:N-acetyltransferase [Clostridia bacterium]
MIRRASKEDLPEILDIYRGAQAFMAETGNPNQWGNFYPSIELLEDDISKQQLYVVVRENILSGVFVFFIGDDPWYDVIDHGDWLDKSPYGVIHRIASRAGEKGIFKEALDFCLSKIGHLRIDTHADNKIMQHIVTKNGFKKCGIIYVHENKSPRIAYELLL